MIKNDDYMINDSDKVSSEVNGYFEYLKNILMKKYVVVSQEINTY